MSERKELRTRRELLIGGAVVVTGAGAYLLLRDGDGGGEDGAGEGGGAGSSTSASGEGQCVLTPELTEGPYYLDEELIRRDITEGRDGSPLQLRLKVQDAERCKPIAGAVVEVWHADAVGAYSGFDEDGTFLRGGQRTGRNGVAVFETIYPGWYQGRTTHIHVKVSKGGNQVHTGQLFFDDSATAAVYRRAPYKSRGQSPIESASDGIFSQGGREQVLALRRRGDGHVGRLTMGVRA